MILYIYLLSIIFSFIEASVPNFIRHPYTRGTGPVDTIDTTSIQVYFALNAWDIRDEKTYCDYFCLEIGKKQISSIVIAGLKQKNEEING